MPEGQKIEAEQKEASTSGDLLADWGTSDKKKKKKKRNSTLNTSPKVSFISQYNPWSSDPMPGTRSSMHPQENYTEFFFSHARLYVFAEKYNIQPLKKLSRQKL